MQRKFITRRALLQTLTAAGAWLVAACSGPDAPQANARARHRTANATVQSNADAASTPTTNHTVGATPASASQLTFGSVTPTPDVQTSVSATPQPTLPVQLSVALDAELPAPLVAVATTCRDQLVQSLNATVATGDADLVLALSNAPDGVSEGPVAHIDYVAIASRRLLVRDVTTQQLTDLWSGALANWSDLGSPDPYGVVRVTLGGSAGPLTADNATVDAATLDDLATIFIQERGALAIIPLAQLDFRFRALNIDGVNALRRGDVPNPLQVTLHVRSRNRLSAADLQRIQEALAAEHGPAPTSMTWTGDIIFGRTVHVKMVEYGDWAAPFRTIWPELVWADTTIGNLECAMSDNFETPTDPTTFDFKTSTAAVAGLQLAQIDVLSRANNHSYNFGEQGMQDTTDVLEVAGILHFGMGHTLAEARRAVVVERNGVTYAFLGYNGISDDWDAATDAGPGTCPMVDWLVVEDIQRELANGHVVIPFFHWGVEYVSDPTEEQRYFAQTAIDAGAAVVMGSHPHWVQAVETYKGKPIVYSLGNFIFDQSWSIETQQGMLAHLWMQGEKALKIDLVPVWIEDQHKPRLMEAWEAAPVLERVWAASDALIAAG